MDKLQGVEGMTKSELIEESQSEEYTSYVYDLWKKATCLAHRLNSRGEKDSLIFFLEERNQRRQSMLNLD